MILNLNPIGSGMRSSKRHKLVQTVMVVPKGFRICGGHRPELSSLDHRAPSGGLPVDVRVVVA
jgi:hypothetical protein